MCSLLHYPIHSLCFCKPKALHPLRGVCCGSVGYWIMYAAPSGAVVVEELEKEIQAIDYPA